MLTGGEMTDYILKKKEGFEFSELSAANILKQVIIGISYCHSEKIVHRDLKPENIMIEKVPGKEGENLKVRIVDFGFAKCFDNQLSDVLGTPYFIAPEVIENKPYNEKCDIWSFGVIAYFTLSGKFPFDAYSRYELFRKIKKGKYDMKCKTYLFLTLKDGVWEGVSDLAKDFLKKALVVNPANRASAKQLAEH
jgi:serine/threonine protein kinase